MTRRRRGIELTEADNASANDGPVSITTFGALVRYRHRLSGLCRKCDTFRAFEGGPGHYSWWSQRFGVRAKNIGWRIDYVLASPSAMPFVRSAFIEPDTQGSDHCPIGVDLDPAIFG